MKKIVLLVIQVMFVSLCFSQKIKNVIVLIPDGASTDLITLSRWYKWYGDSTNINTEPLALDEIICGMVKTHCIDGKFPDSAPTSTAYATGVKSIAPYIGVDQFKQPHISVLELAKMKGLSTGVVVTCEFPHATPADFVCHFNDREGGKYENLAKQFVYNSPSLVFAGGGRYLSQELKDTLINRGFEVRKTLPNTNEKQTKIWSLFSDYKHDKYAKSFECDRNSETEPSLSQMTDTAIKILSRNTTGFFLMVEGSEIDWACHYNDPKAAITDFVEYDKALQVALKFAKENKNTLIIACPDHGNGGISMGNKNSSPRLINPNTKTPYYNVKIADDIIFPLRRIKCSARKIADSLFSNPKKTAYRSFIKENYNLSISNADSVEIYKTMTCGWSIEDKISSVEQFIGSKYSEQNFIGWTTSGHTAEDVFLGIYHPDPSKRLTGVVDNKDIAAYIWKEMGWKAADTTTTQYFNKVKLETTFPNFTAKKTNEGLVFESKNQTITLVPNVDFYLLNGKIQYTKKRTLIVNIKNNYYVPQEVIDLLKK